MPSQSTTSSSATAAPRPFPAALVLAIAIVAAYATSFRGVMVFDDVHAIAENPTIRELSRPDLVLFPPGVEGGTIGGRPVVNLTLALNYAVSGLEPWGYHAVNLAIHLLAGLTLLGLARRTLLRQGYGGQALGLGGAVAALWALHPLQTESVTYIIQRAESLCGLFFLLTLYCFVRSVESPRPRGWQVAAVAACLAGMGTKEVMVAAPLLVFLYDRTFVAGSFAGAWRQRRTFHLALAATWLLLAWLVAGTAGRGGTAGFATVIAWWQYAFTQCHAIVHYLRLALWPHPLVFDYGTPLFPLGAVLLPAGLLLLLLGATGWALLRRPALGFLGAWFFLVLAPSSSVMPVATQTMAEHRMYLPLAAALALLVLGVHALAGPRARFGLLALAAVAGGLTARRNLAYHSELALWADTVAHCPENARAHTNLGIALTLAERLPDAEAAFKEALRLEPNDPAANLNLCNVLGQLGRLPEAAAFGETAVRLDPKSVPAHVNLAYTLEQLGRTEEAVRHYEESLRLEPDAPNVPARLAALLYTLGNQAAARENFDLAITRYRRVLELDADHVPARNNLANALLVSGHVAEAITLYRELLQQNPGDQRVRENLARALELHR